MLCLLVCENRSYIRDATCRMQIYIDHSNLVCWMYVTWTLDRAMNVIECQIAKHSSKAKNKYNMFRFVAS